MSKVSINLDEMTAKRIGVVNTKYARKQVQDFIKKHISEKHTVIAEYNKNHDEKGRFSSADRAVRISYKDGTKISVADVRKQAQILIAKASSKNDAFQKTVSDLAKKLNTKALAGPVKKIDRVVEKVIEDYHGDVSKIKDIVRATIEIRDPNDISKYVKQAKKDLSVIGEKNTMREKGYRDYKLTIGLGNDVKAEIIIATPAVLYAKASKKKGGLGGHDLYNIVRAKSTPSALSKEVNQKMTDLYTWSNNETIANAKKGNPLFLDDYIKEGIQPK